MFWDPLALFCRRPRPIFTRIVGLRHEGLSYAAISAVLKPKVWRRQLASHAGTGHMSTGSCMPGTLGRSSRKPARKRGNPRMSGRKPMSRYLCALTVPESVRPSRHTVPRGGHAS